MPEIYRPEDQGTARLITVIETTLTVRGLTPADQLARDTARIVRQYWTTDGELIAEVDDWEGASPGVEEGWR